MCLARVASCKAFGHGLGVLCGFRWEFFSGFCRYFAGVFPYIYVAHQLSLVTLCICAGSACIEKSAVMSQRCTCAEEWMEEHDLAVAGLW